MYGRWNYVSKYRSSFSYCRNGYKISWKSFR
nr:MAG TPA: hypothetical protein [Caudoviricetes sp.]